MRLLHTMLRVGDLEKPPSSMVENDVIITIGAD